jgi:protein-tyrosine-phosphatase
MSAEHQSLTRSVLFVCLHGSAKSLIAAEHLNRLAKQLSVSVHGESAGIEPDADVPPAVLAGLSIDGIDVHEYRPRQVTTERLAAATHVVLCGCELSPSFATISSVERWDDLPFVSDGYDAARTAIVERVDDLLARLAAWRPKLGR